MKKTIFYDKKSDIKWIVIAEGVESYTEELAPNILGEYNSEDQLIGIEIQNASQPQEIHNFRLNSSAEEKIVTYSEKNPSSYNVILSQNSDKRLSGVSL